MGITVQQETLQTARFLGEVSRDQQVEGRLGLPPGSPPMASLGSCRARIRDLRAVSAAGYVAVEGLVEVDAIYLTPATDPERAAVAEHLAVWSKENGGAIAFTQEIPLAAAEPGLAAAAGAMVTGVAAEIQESQTLRCQIGLELTASVTSFPSAVVATDLSPSDRLSVTRENLRLELPAGQTEVEVPVSMVLALPEIKPDILRILSRAARLTEITAEIARGKAIVGGRLEVNAVYVGRLDEGGETIESCDWGGEGRPPLGYEAFVDLAPYGAEAAVEPGARLGRFVLEQIGPREIRLDASVAVTVKAVQTKQISLLTEIVAEPDAVTDLLWTQVDCLNLVGRAEGEIGLETTLEIPPGKPELEKILQIRAEARGLSAQAAEGKCLIDGWLDFSLLYRGEAAEGGPPVLAAVDWARNQGTSLPIAEVMELPEAAPGLETQLTWRLSRLAVEPIAPRVLRLVASLWALVKVTERKLLPAITDAAVVPLAPAAGRPSMLFYVVQPGDTLWRIARRYESTVEALTRINKIADPDQLYPGNKLLIPKSPVAV